MRSMIYVGTSKAYLKNNEKPLAFQVAKTAVQECPSAEAYEQLAFLHFTSFDFEQALVVISEAKTIVNGKTDAMVRILKMEEVLQKEVQSPGFVNRKATHEELRRLLATE